MAKYRKKPVVIDAIQWDGTKEGVDKIQAEFPALQTLLFRLKEDLATEVWFWKIGTLEGNHIVSNGDFIIRGVAGEVYPCKPDIFLKTYAAVSA